MLRTIVLQQSVKIKKRSRNKKLNKCWSLCSSLSQLLHRDELTHGVQERGMLLHPALQQCWIHWEQWPARQDRGTGRGELCPTALHSIYGRSFTNSKSGLKKEKKIFSAKFYSLGRSLRRWNCKNSWMTMLKTLWTFYLRTSSHVLKRNFK